MLSLRCWMAAWICVGIAILAAANSRAAEPGSSPHSEQSARLSDEITQTTGKLRQIGLAFLNFEYRNHQFPARAIFDKQGKRLLSWRVQILPFIGESDLYKQFHLDEPWDSAHNKALIERMPALYASPHRPHDFKTTFLVPVGKGLAFDGSEGLIVNTGAGPGEDAGAVAARARDRIRMTILAVEANDDRAVTWTKPDDLEVDLQKPREGLGDTKAGVFEALFGDGHVDFFPKTIKPKKLRSLLTLPRPDQTLDNLREISVAFQVFEERNHRLPARAIFDKQGKPLLSWRVQILPSLDQSDLYNQFHLDEFWDSEHNKPLIEKMPAFYASPHRPHDFKTPFLVPVGKGLAFEGSEARTFHSYDEVRKTIVVVEANDDRAVTWTKPEDLQVDLRKPLEGVGGTEEGGFKALFGDGHIGFVRKTIKPETMQSLLTWPRQTSEGSPAPLP